MIHPESKNAKLMRHHKGHSPLIPISVLLISLAVATAQPQSTNFQLRIERLTNSVELLVGGTADAGAFFIYQAHDLQSLLINPSLAVQTNTLLTNGLRFTLPTFGVSPQQTFFTAAHWPGRTVEEFGDPENYPDIPPPAMLLFTDGAPEPLASGQTFTVDFYITNPSGQVMDVSGPVAILVFRASDGARHPDATVLPATAPLTNGHMRVPVTVQAATTLSGYVLGLGPASGAGAPFLEGFFTPASSGLNQNVSAAANISPQTLGQRRSANADAGPSWSYPLAGGGHPVSGTFGEWRGRDNNNVHRGVDLAAVAASTVAASRGGVVSHQGTLPGMGDYIVLDHGGGWFSRYLHLDAANISVTFGQAVVRGATLATRLYAVGAWPQHLHFEVRNGADEARWHDSLVLTVPGRDPLQEPQIFAIAPGSNLPELREFGLTRQHPGEHAFVKSNPTADAPGPVYVFAKFRDFEGGHRLGLRSMNFRPDLATSNNWVWPSNDTAIALLLPPASSQPRGFARYDGPHAANPDPANYFRYWWRWDTADYATNRSGPRSLVLIGEDHAPSTAEFRFTFGPQVKGGTLTPLSANQYQFTNVAHLGTNTPAALNNAALYVQPDQYKLEIIRPNGQPLGGVAWAGPMAGNYTRVFTTHLDEAVYTFTLPAGATTEALKLRVSSRLVPDIAHEICLCGGPDMAFIPAGPFVMGDPLNDSPGGKEQPIHTVQVSAFCMDKHEVTKALWDDVYNWAITHGYSFNFWEGKAANHPAHSMTWYDAVRWCNARSEKEGRTPAYYTSAAQTTVYRSGQVNVDNSWVKWNVGYRLPTEAEWEKAARGGASGQRFPWGSTITHAQANYYGYPASSGGYAYDLAPLGYHPAFNDGVFPYTSPVGAFAPNGYGLYDMAGNVWEWCSDWYGVYSSGSQTDPRGPTTGSYRVIRGGGWSGYAINCRSARRHDNNPDYRNSDIGFRSVLPPGQP